MVKGSQGEASIHSQKFGYVAMSILNGRSREGEDEHVCVR